MKIEPLVRLVAGKNICGITEQRRFEALLENRFVSRLGNYSSRCQRGIMQARSFPPGKSFENGAGRIELFCFLEADGADDGAAVGHRVDEAVGFQQP